MSNVIQLVGNQCPPTTSSEATSKFLQPGLFEFEYDARDYCFGAAPCFLRPLPAAIGVKSSALERQSRCAPGARVAYELPPPAGLDCSS